VENVDGSRARNEFSNFIDVAGYSVPLEGKSFVWNAQCEKWVEADYSAKYGYMQGEVSETDVSRLYLPYYGIAEPADPVLATSDFGRGSSIPIVVALSIIAGLVAAVFFWLK